jgi:hypothetical protein
VAARLGDDAASSKDDVAHFRVTQGARSSDEAGALLRPLHGRVVLEAPLDPRGRRRCAAVGFVLGNEQPLRLRVSLAADADVVPLEPTLIDLPAAEVLAGVVEVAARPTSLSGVVIEIDVDGDVEALSVADLFVVTYG